MPAQLLKISYPFPSNKHGQVFTDSEALFTLIGGESSGQYLVGSQGMWHGGIHITDATVPWCALSSDSAAEQEYVREPYKGEQFIRCMADGEIVAYRVCKDYEFIEWGDDKLYFSTSFVLVKHYIQPGPTDASGLTFHTLYMNLAPLSAYATQGNERIRKAKGQKHYPTQEAVISGTQGGTLAAGTRVTLGDKTMTRASDKHQFSEVTLADGTQAWTASDQGFLSPVTAADGAATPVWWNECSPAYSTTPASLTVMKTTDSLRSYLSQEDVLAGTESVSLPTGTVVTVEQQNALHQMTKGSGEAMRKFSLVTLTTDAGRPKRLRGDRVWVLSDNNNLVAAGGDASAAPIFKDVVIPGSPIKIKSGDNIGHMGFYQLPEDNGKRSRYQVHIECLSMDSRLPVFLTNPESVAVEDKAAFLKYPEGAPLFIKNAQGQIAGSTLKTKNQGIATRSKVAEVGADGQPVAAGTAPVYYPINQEHGWLAAANVQKVSQYDLRELGFVTLDKAPESFDLIDGLTHPDNVVKGILDQMYKAAQDETRTSHALNEYNYKRLLDQIDSNKDGYYSEAEYLQAIHNVSYRDHLNRIIAKHASEWYYGKDDPLWKTYLDTLTRDAPEWKTYTEAFIEKMAWMKQVEGMGPEPWHMHPVVFLGALIDDDGMAIKWLKVEKGQITFDAEGNDIAGNRYFSRRIHWPGNDLSGVTLGRGYDMGGRSKSSIYDDMIASGIESGKADEISTAAGLKGSAAMEFVLANRDTIGDITRMQQNKLFDLIYPAYVTRTQGNYATKTAGVTEALPWESLEQKIQDILVDFIYQGFSGERPMRAGMKNSRKELISYIENNTTISSYENGRHRANYLRGQ